MIFAAMPNDEKRFGFGENWKAFLSTLNDERIRQAEQSLLAALGMQDFSDKEFLDVGCGSGLFSLAAKKLNAGRVHSFDYDPHSVGCAMELKRRYFADDGSWTIEQGSILDEAFVQSLGQFDIVYAWGVLHHTGNMWKALDMVGRLVKPGGALFLAIYHDAGLYSRVWLALKYLYNVLPGSLRTPYLLLCLPLTDGPSVVRNLVNGRLPFVHWKEYYVNRGMSRWHDVKDWVGGYPFEFARQDQIFNHFRPKGFRLDRLNYSGPGGNNEFVFFLEQDNRQE